MTMNQDIPMTLAFRCLPELEPLLPKPIPAVQGLPTWFKAMPQKAFNALAHADEQTVKRCPPFIDAMTCGFLIPLVCDLKVENGEFSWDFDLPAATTLRSPIGFHDASQAIGTPLYDANRFIIKFHNFWTVRAPPGYSLLFTHPVNRPDLPFTTLTGLVDSDLYCDTYVHFPAHWRDPNFNGVLPMGTPIAQCIPVKRESWVGQITKLSDNEVKSLNALAAQISREPSIYRHNFRAGKR